MNQDLKNEARTRMRTHNFLFHCMTQAELALDGQDQARMAEALRSILQGAYDLHSTERREAADALAGGQHLAAG